MFFLKPRVDKFFVLFSDSSRAVRDGANVLRDAMRDFNDLEHKMQLITEIEHNAHAINDDIVDLLNRTFITPLDREDIFSLAGVLDDIVDFLQGVMERMVLYKTGKPSEGATELARLLAESTDELVQAIDMIKNIKGNKDKILDHTRRMVALESEGDYIYRQEIANLFSTCPDPVAIIKWKEVLEHLEESLDHCEKLADLLRGVVMKYA